MVLWRGKGFLVPLVLLSVFLLSPESNGVELTAWLWASCLVFVLFAIWLVWYGRRSLVRAESFLGRPLKRYEWFIDVNGDQVPFHSFMFIQLPWWAILYAVVVVPMLSRALHAS